MLLMVEDEDYMMLKSFQWFIDVLPADVDDAVLIERSKYDDDDVLIEISEYDDVLIEISEYDDDVLIEISEYDHDDVLI